MGKFRLWIFLLKRHLSHFINSSIKNTKIEFYFKKENVLYFFFYFRGISVLRDWTLQEIIFITQNPRQIRVSVRAYVWYMYNLFVLFAEPLLGPCFVNDLCYSHHLVISIMYWHTEQGIGPVSGDFVHVIIVPRILYN